MAGERHPRSRAARKAAEEGLARILFHYGQRPEFVVIGGLVPDLLCSKSTFLHAGTTDVDIQVDLEIACGSVNTSRLEDALRKSGFGPERGRNWRWISEGDLGAGAIKFELLADLRDEPAGSTIKFDNCDELGAVNLRGTGFASLDCGLCKLPVKANGIDHIVEVRSAGLAGFLLSKAAAAYSRRLPKDWYDIAFVLLNNDLGGPVAAAKRVRSLFSGKLAAARTSLRELRANFATADDYGTRAFAQQMQADNPEIDCEAIASDAVLAVEHFCDGLSREPE